jgi:hypothetical protein
MSVPPNVPQKRVPRKAPPLKAVKREAEPGDPKYDWRTVYPDTVSLFKYTSQDGKVLCIPAYEDPGEGEIFGLMLLNKNEQELLIYTMRQHITRNARDPEHALLVTFQALKNMRAPGTVETFLKSWPEAAGKDLGKS